MATGESKPRMCPNPEEITLCRQYALCDRTDKYNSKIQSRFGVIRGPSHAIYLVFFLFSLPAECGILGKFIPFLVHTHPVVGPGNSLVWQLFWGDSCKLLEKRDLNLYQGIRGTRPAPLSSSARKPEGMMFKSCCHTCKDSSRWNFLCTCRLLK